MFTSLFLTPLRHHISHGRQHLPTARATAPRIPREQLGSCRPSWPEANGHSAPQSFGVHCLSKVPSIWRELPSLPVTDSTAQAMVGGPGRDCSVCCACLGSAKPKLCTPTSFSSSLRTMHIMVLPTPCPAMPTSIFETPRRVQLAIQPQAAGTVECDCHRLRARPRRLTLGLQRLH